MGLLSLDSIQWNTSEIAEADSLRGRDLNEEISPTSLLASLQNEFERALANEVIRFGAEQAGRDRSDLRIVIQFKVSPVIYDRFFNGRVGYRAHFFSGEQLGLEFNSSVIERIAECIAEERWDAKEGRLLSPEFEDLGPIRIEKHFVLKSLDTYLAKIWWCGKLLAGDGPSRTLPSGSLGPRIRFEDGTTWAAMYRDADDSWLDVKGAFCGRTGLYQPKDPALRAARLRKDGTA